MSLRGQHFGSLRETLTIKVALAGTAERFPLNHLWDAANDLVVIRRAVLSRNAGARRLCHIAWTHLKPARASSDSIDDGCTSASSPGGRRPRADTGSGRDSWKRR